MLMLPLAVCPLVAGGQQHYVSHWGTHVAPYTSWLTAATNIADAIDAAAEGAIIWVTNGVYRTGTTTGGGHQNRLALTKSVTIRSVNGYSNTFIEGQFHALDTPLGAAAVRGVYMTAGTLDGFTIRRGTTAGEDQGTGSAGGGLYAAGGTQINIRVTGNYGHTAGGGWLENAYLSNVIFRINESVQGPRVHSGRRVRMANCIIDNRPYPSPDLKVIGTNGVVIVNGDPDIESGHGQWFGEHHIFSGSDTRTFTLTNQGSRVLIISSVYIASGHLDDFTVLSPPPGVLMPGETKTIEVRFDPTVKGQRRALLYIESNDPDDSPYAVWLGGEGLQYELQVVGINGEWINNGESVPDLAKGTDFGLCIADPIRHRFSITNAGVDLLTFTNTPRIVIGGANPGDFIVTLQPAQTLLPGEITEFEIEFFPLIATTRTAEVYIYSDDFFHTNGLYQFSIQGDCPTTNSFMNIRAGLRDVGGSSMAWGDYDNDGLLDLAVLGYDGTNRFTTIYRNLGGGNFTNINAGLLGVESGSLAWGDFNNDGWLDLAVAGGTGVGVSTRIYRNNGDGTFGNLGAELPGVMNGAVSWADFDNDGDLDLLITGYTLTAPLARLYRNNGDETFTLEQTNLLPVENGTAAWVDVDRDGWMDLIVTGDSATGKTTRLYWNLEGSLTNYPMPNVRSAAFGGLSVGDYNNDGWPDLALTGYGTNGMIADVYRHNGTAAIFTRVNTTLAPLWLGETAWGDVNNNGWLDLITSGQSTGNVRSVNLYINTTGALRRLDTQIPGMRVASVALADYDADGDLDIAVAGLSTNGYFSAVFRNLANVSNAPPSAPTGLTAFLTNGNELVMSWDAATDDRTPAHSLTYNLYVGTPDNPIAVMSPHADLVSGQRRSSGHGNTHYRRIWTLRYLPAGQEIVWGVQAIDGAYAASAFSEGPPVTTGLLPDLMIDAIAVQAIPRQITITVSNRGPSATTGPVLLSSWLHRTNATACGIRSDFTNTVDILASGGVTNIILTDLPAVTNNATLTFRAFVNSVCNPTELEVRMDNNQRTLVYTNRVYEPFWINAVPLTDSVYIRWSDPANSGMDTSQVMLRWSSTSFPQTPSEGSEIYNGTDRVFHHTGRPAGIPNYYGIWVTHDGVTWIEPP